MGWDAYAQYSDGRPVEIDWKNHKAGTEPELKDAALKAAFAAAAQSIKDSGLSVDWLLPLAGLDVSTCGEALASATGASVYDEDGWEAKKVKRLASDARWPDDPEEAKRWAVACAKAFLETCAANDLRIDFSW